METIPPNKGGVILMLIAKIIVFFIVWLILCIVIKWGTKFY